jgi:putative transposase
MKVPREVYGPSPRPYRGLCEVDYPFHDWTVTVTHCGRICYKQRKINLSKAFAGQNVGVRQVSDRIWLVSFMDYDLGYLDNETCRLEPIGNRHSLGSNPSTSTNVQNGLSDEPLAAGGTQRVGEGNSP